MSSSYSIGDKAKKPNKKEYKKVKKDEADVNKGLVEVERVQQDSKKENQNEQVVKKDDDDKKKKQSSNSSEDKDESSTLSAESKVPSSSSSEDKDKDDQASQSSSDYETESKGSSEGASNMTESVSDESISQNTRNRKKKEKNRGESSMSGSSQFEIEETTEIPVRSGKKIEGGPDGVHLRWKNIKYEVPNKSDKKCRCCDDEVLGYTKNFARHFWRSAPRRHVRYHRT